uniref:Portal protein n=1 Tax=Pseudomonas phage HRDY3 TaxID=3236930 RepID=A0AB39CE99_9VIRU
MKLPVYKCHKEVEAFKIQSITAQALGTAAGDIVPPVLVAVGLNDDGSPRLLPSAQKTEYVLADETGEFSVVVDEDFITRHNVYTEGYFVRYSNGHQSFSPKEAFEEGYTVSEEKRVIVIRVGNDRWTPSMDDLQQVMEMFMHATLDPEGAVVAVNHAVRLELDQVLRTETDNLYVCSIDEKRDLKTLLAQAKENKE